MLALVDASKVPAPLKGAAAVSAKVELAPCVKLPVSVMLEMVTVPVLLFVRVLVDAGVTLPPKVISLAPANA